MSAYDYDAPPRDREYSRRQYREERRDRDPRYLDTQDPYYRGGASSRNELVPRPREDSDLSVEEIRRDFPPPGYSRDIRRARSAEPGYDDYYYDSRRDYDARSTRDSPRDARSSKKAGSVYYEEEEKTRKRVLSKQEKIVAAVLGGVLAAGAKEVWDRREANQEGHNGEVNRNLMASAALGAAGALAGYQGADFYNKHAEKENKKSTYIMHKGRDGRVQEYYSDEEEDPKSQKGNKNFIESALAAAGLGGAIKALTGGGDKDKDKDDHRSDTKSRRGGSPDSKKTDTPANRMQQAAKASLVAGAAEAFRVAREPGGWKGEKMKRVLTAAAGAATIDAAHDPSKDTKRHLLESVVGGLVGNRVINGSRKDIEEDKKTGRSRSRSRARSDGGGGGGATGLAALATAGLGAFGAKKLLDKRDESRGRGASPDSRDSRDGSPRRRQRSRSRSVVDTARRGLARLGIGNGPEEDRDDHDDSRSRRSRRTRSPDDRYDDDGYSSRNYGSRGGGRDDYYDDDRSAKSGRRRSRSRQRGGRSGSASSSDLGDSEDDEKRAKKMRDGHRRRHHD